MPFVIRHGSAAQAAMAKESGRARGEALEAQAEAQHYLQLSDMVLDTVNRYNDRKQRERELEARQREAEMQRDHEAEQSGLDRDNRLEAARIGAGSRESIAALNLEGRISAVEKQQQGATEREKLKQGGATERLQVTETGRNQRAEVAETGRDQRFGVLNQQRDRGIALREGDAARKQAEQEKIAQSAAAAVQLRYEDGEPDAFGKLAIDMLSSGQTLPKWLENRLPGKDPTAIGREKPSETQRALAAAASLDPGAVWRMASESKPGPDGEPSGVPTMQAAAAQRALLEVVQSPATPPDQLRRMHAEFRLLNARQPDPALEELLRIIEERIGQQPMPAGGGAEQQGGGFWGTVGSALGALSPARLGARAGAALGGAMGGGGSPSPAAAAPNDADAKLDAILATMSPEEIKALLAGE